MLQKPLLLRSAKSAVLVDFPRERGSWVRTAAIAVGLITVLVGAADAAARVSRAAFGENANFFIFGPPASAWPEPASARQRPSAVEGTELPAQSASGAIVPARLRVPSLGIDAAVERVGKRADGSMGIPKNFDDVSWYMPGGKPGSEGNAVFAGHLNNARGQTGVFARLARISIGDYVTVADAEGKTLPYVVREVQVYPADEAPAEAIFKTSGPSQLVLITCEGDWVPQERTFDKRLVVIARPAY